MNEQIPEKFEFMKNQFTEIIHQVNAVLNILLPFEINSLKIRR